MTVDSTTVEVIRGALTYTAEEMGIALKKSAYSPNIKERMDHSCALFDEKYRLIAQAEHIPVHLGSMAYGVKEGMTNFRGNLEPGDMILLNDPYLSGTHLPDLTLIAPIFYERRIIGYSANKAHHTDVGGRTPGSLSADSTELYNEGLIIPPVKIMKKGVLDNELTQLISSNVRTPETQMGDLKAQIAANNTGIIRVHELTREYGTKILCTSMDEIMNYSEHRMRSIIKSMPEGQYSASDSLEEINGVEPIISVTISVCRDSLTIDYTGSSNQVEAPVNAPLGVTIAGIYYTLLSVTDNSIPVNDGCFRSITLKVPKGTLMNPIRPAPVAGGNVETSQRNVDALMKVFSQIIPENIPAAGLGTMNNITIGGVRADGAPWTFYETIGGGSGGRPTGDGIDGVHVNMTNTMNTPIEALEAYLPLRFDSYSLIPDSGGAGKYRGGCGIERSWTLLSSKATLNILAERTKNPPWGIKGGQPGALGEYWLHKKTGEKIKLPSKTTIKIVEGDKLIIKTPGGGGYGNPLERLPSDVLRDLQNGFITKKSAINQYGVVFDVNGIIDEAETNQLRIEKNKK
ncbi:hydantoinase B/oxoprolinase family protein [Candidatus Bathyarchaeota archaeon]|nr:hydantoinase B/oxoprolinase family protein [Candidatus Bathyarchaeota archaeon]